MSTNDNDRNLPQADGVATGEIRRVSHEALAYHGWRLDVCPRKGHCIRFFADRDYGGQGGALKAARMARAALLMEEWR